MVGAKSVGCATCKSRKIKCDERFPICANCERTKRYCPGPKARFIRFIGPGNEEHMRGETVQISILQPPSSSPSERLAARLATRLDGVKEIGCQLQTLALANFFPYLVPRVGHSAALDAAVKCILDAHRNFVLGVGTSCDEDLLNYNRAVALIRADLNGLQRKTPSEIICASMLLCRYEILKGDLSAWFTHAGGVAALMEARGPDRITSDFDLALFRCHYGAIVSASVFTGKECFLTTPAWDAVRIRCFSSKLVFDRNLSDVLAVLATLPAVFRMPRRECLGLFSARLHAARCFKANLSKLAPVMQQDYENPKIVYQLPAPRTSCMPTYHKFCSFMMATRYCIWWATIIIANSILIRQGEIDSSLSHESQSAADNICRSIEYFRQLKPIGPHQVKVAVALAFGVSSSERRQQILHEVADLLDPEPPEGWYAELQFIFDTLTGIRGVGDEDGLESFVRSPNVVPLAYERQ